jgi:uncharacterized protein YdhG (YjbR/CyaY superfamily)
MPSDKPASISAYIAALPESSRPIAEILCQTIRLAAPACVETVKYGIPTFKIGNRSLIYFGVWKKHIGLYPIYRGTDAFEAEIAPYRVKTDTVQFFLSEPMPLELIARIVESQLANLRS